MPLSIDVSLVNDDNTEDLVNAYSVMTSGKWDKKSTLLPLNYLSSLMADTLFFSYYDIMIIQSSYLILWSKTDSFSKVPLITLLSMFDPQYHGVITSYFKNGTFSSNDYLCFVCLFSFFDYRQIVTVMVSMIKIYSNLFITQNQITTFVHSFGLSDSIKNNLNNYLLDKHTELNECGYIYNMRDFLWFLNNDDEFKCFIYHFQEAVRCNVFSEKDYFIIKNKINYYYTHKKDDIPPKEPCQVRLFRKLFTKRPPPYSYNFGLLSCSDKSKESIIILLKQNYGYGSRISNTFSLTPSLKIIQSNHNTLKCSSSGGRARSRTNTLCYADFMAKRDNYYSRYSYK